MSRDILKRMSDPQIVALRCKGSAWPRSRLSETPIPDAWMGLVISPDGRRRFLPAGENPRPARDDALALVRNRALTVALRVTEVPATDHPVSAIVEVLLRCPPQDNELGALDKTLLAGEELTLANLTQAVNQAGATAALRQFARARSASQLVHEEQREPLLGTLRGALQRFLFSSGLVLERLGQVQFTSESLAQQEKLARTAAERLEEIKSRDMVEQAALVATRRRVDDLGGLLGRLKQVAGEGAGRWSELLPALAPAERGRLLENLWRVTPDQLVAQAIVAVAGQTCVWLDPADPDQVLQRMAVDEALGGLRSVSFDQQHGWLLVGAARGVWVFRAADGTVIGGYLVPDAGRPRMGFNAAVVAGERLVATHSQLGCWSWPIAQPREGTVHLRPTDGVPKTIRAATVDARGRVLFAADDSVCILGAAGEELRRTSPVTAPITCLATLGDDIYAGTADGHVWNQSPAGHPGLADADMWTVVHRTRSALESIVARSWGGLVELVIPAGSNGISGVYAEAGVVARVVESVVPIRRVWASDDTLVGLSENRDRLVVLHTSMPGRAGRAIPLARLLGGLIQDACIVTSEAMKSA
jgi:hypothetical protein